MTSQKEQSGMQNMRTRINQMGGEMNVVNVPNTQLQFTLPIAAQRNINDAIATSSNVTNG